MKRDPGQFAGSLLDIYFNHDHMESRSIGVETRRNLHIAQLGKDWHVHYFSLIPLRELQLRSTYKERSSATVHEAIATLPRA